MSSNSLANTNKLIVEMDDILSLLTQKNFFDKLKSTKVNWDLKEVSNLPDDLVKIMESKNFIRYSDNKYILTPMGTSFLGKLLVNVESIKNSHELQEKYVISQVVSNGKNSVTFKATHKFLGRDVALKVIRPGSGESIIEKLKQIGQVGGEPYLIHPIDYIEIKHPTLTGSDVKLKCLVFPYINGETLEAFLSRAKPVSPFFIYTFIKQIATALSALEKHQLYHGDLHSNNILVTEKDRILFQIIDISCGVGEHSPYDYGFNDFDHFREHLWRALRILQINLPRLSIRKHLGPELFSTAEHILNEKLMSFREVLDILHNRTAFLSYEKKRNVFISKKFKEPLPMGLLRYEEFANHQLAMELFEPYPELLAEISQFGNSIIYGHRGSGKSTYLSALSCSPDIMSPLFDMKDKFGIFFACRQGEFRQFSQDLVEISPRSILLLKHIIILKIIRRFIDIINEAINYERLKHVDDIDSLVNFLSPFVAGGVAHHYDLEIVSPLDNLHASLLRNEINEIDNLFSTKKIKFSSLLDEGHLVKFFRLFREIFSELKKSQFYILFDDAGEPNVSKATQWVINDIMRNINSVYCVKLSAERYSYKLKDSKNKALEESHDYSSFDISAKLSLGSGFSPERNMLKAYFKKIIEKRLAHWNYQSHDISDYLGEQPISTDELVYRLANSKRDAYYSGWNVIWELSNRTTRNLLELISEVLIAGGIIQSSEINKIPDRIQHQTIKAFSEKKLKSLIYIPGKLMLNNQKCGLGIKLYEFVASFGKISREYLTKKSVNSLTKKYRFDERIAIERDDFEPLSRNVDLFLRALIRYAVLDDVELVFSRDDKIKKPIYTLNRIFCPAFKISYRRDSHLRLGRKQFELLLTEPRLFVRRGTGFLRSLSIPDEEMSDLFGRLNEE